MDEPNYVGIGARIRGFRKGRNLTQEKLAEKAGVEPSNLSHIERGATKVSLPTLLKIANALEVSLDDLVYDSLEKSRHISYKTLEDILSDCTDREVQSITEMAQLMKSLLRK